MKNPMLFYFAFIFISAPGFEATGQDVLIAVKKGPAWGYVNATGAYQIQPRFDQAYPFYNDRAVAVENKLFGVIDPEGKWVIAPQAGEVNPEINSNRISCSNDAGQWGAMDLGGKVVVPFENDALSAFQNGLALAGKKSANPDLFRIIVIDTVGQPVISFDNIYLPAKLLPRGKKVREGYVSVLVDGNFGASLTPAEVALSGRPLFYGLLDVKNKRLVNLKINSLGAEVREGRLNLSIDGISYSWHAPLTSEPSLNEAKFTVLSPAIHPFSSGIAAIQKDGKWAFVDKDGSLLTETMLPVTEYLNEMPLYGGGFVIFWKKSGKGIYADLNGNQKIPMEFEELLPFQGGGAVVKYKGKYGLIQKDGTWALPAEYDGMRF